MRPLQGYLPVEAEFCTKIRSKVKKVQMMSTGRHRSRSLACYIAEVAQNIVASFHHYLFAEGVESLREIRNDRPLGRRECTNRRMSRRTR
jgi:hypothetical protein